MCDKWLYKALSRGGTGVTSVQVGATSTPLCGQSPLRWALGLFTTEPGQLWISPSNPVIVGQGINVGNALPSGLMCLEQFGPLPCLAMWGISANGDMLTVTVIEVLLDQYSMEDVSQIETGRMSLNAPWTPGR